MKKAYTRISKANQVNRQKSIGNAAENAIVSGLLGYSQIDTLLPRSYIPIWRGDKKSYIRFFNQCGTRTGRLSCSNPNLLQIPKHTENGKLVRKMFTARPGMLLGDCDFGQIEPRVLAHLSKDANMCRMFNDGIRLSRLHSRTAWY